MTKFPVVLDLETKHTFRDYADAKKLGITVAAIYNYKDQQAQVFFEDQLPQLYPILESSSYLIGYNIREFDLTVLQGYYPGRVDQFAVFDILEDIKNKIGKRLALNDLVFATLNKKKTGHGLLAIDYFKSKQWEKLKNYCLDDVLLTKELFDFGVKNGQVYHLTANGKETIKVDWKKYIEGQQDKDISLTLPF